MKRYKEAQVEYKLIDEKTIELLNEFINLSKLLYNIVINKENDLNEINKLRPYKKFSFINKVLKIIDQEFTNSNNSNEIDILFNQIKTKSANVFKFIKNYNFKSLSNYNIENEFNKLQKLIEPKESKIIRSISSLNSILKSNLGFIFNAGNKIGLLDSFDRKDWEKLNTSNFKDISFNYLQEPTYKNDFEYFVYYIYKIKNDNIPLNLEQDEFQDYIKLIYKKDPNFKKFEKYMDSYLYSNNKKIIPQLMNLIKLFPIIEKENNDSKLSIKEVYRGIKFNEKDNLYYSFLKKQKVDYEFAATSLDKYSAKNFAKGENYLFHSGDDNNFDNKIGLILTYKVKPNDILINFNILKTVYQEGEVLINTKTAILSKVEEI